MKNIFKKNHVIITALAIMIVIAGYLSFTNRDAADEGDAVATEASNSGDYEEYAGEDGVDVATNTNTDTTTTDTTTGTNDTTTTTTDTTDTTTTTTSDTNTTDDNNETAPADTQNTDELGDISDEDILADAQDVTDNGELNLEEGVPGEAVLANAAIDPSYFISNKIEREQVRAKSKEIYKEIMESTEATEEQRQQAIDAMLELTDIAEKENATETLLGAKGFDGAIVYINDGKVEVVVNAAALTDQQLAIVESVVKEKTGIAVENIGINPVVVSE